MKILHLTLKKKWYDMILSGEKTDEYREIKPYWNKRLDKYHDCIEFKNGYLKTSPSFRREFISLTAGYGKSEWGAPIDKPVYILKLGDIIIDK